MGLDSKVLECFCGGRLWESVELGFHPLSLPLSLQLPLWIQGVENTDEPLGPS